MQLRLPGVDRAPWAPRGWALSSLSFGARCYVAGLPLLALVGALWGLPNASFDRHDALLALLLVGAGAWSVETTRRVGQPANTVVKDLLSAWWLPLAVLLPPVVVLLAPFPLLALLQWRVQATLVYRRVFSAAASGLAYAGASLAFHAVLNEPIAGQSHRLLTWAVGVGLAGVAGAAGNAVLVAVAVKVVDPQTSWRELLWSPEKLRLDAVEICLGVVVAIMAGLEPLLVAFTLPPVLLLQRGLLHAQMRAAALLDPKTALLNAVAWEREAQGKLLALRRRKLPASVLLIDIDHFKAVNDAHGHLAGDLVLRAVAGALTGAVREGDLLGRFGGEEFVALLPAADAEETDLVAERLRRHIAALVVPLDNGHVGRVTVSIGVAATPCSELSVPDLLAAADRCMYQAKAAGRNQVAPHLSPVRA